jgi:hypothetical protein
LDLKYLAKWKKARKRRNFWNRVKNLKFLTSPKFTFLTGFLLGVLAGFLLGRFTGDKSENKKHVAKDT